MKKILFSFFALLMASSLITAQDAEGLYKQASKTWKNYASADASEKLNILNDAAAQLDEAMDTAKELDAKKASKIYKLRGDVYTELATQYVAQYTLDNNFEVKSFDAGEKAFESYQTLYENAEKKFNKRDGEAGMKQSLGLLSQMASIAYEKRNYEKSFENFDELIKAYDYLEEKGIKSEFFATKDDYNTNMLYAGLTANAAGKTDEAKPYIEKLYAVGYDDPGVYENMYKIYAESDSEKALKALSEGREKFPENEGLLVTEINYYMQNDKLDELVDKLKKAIDLDPSNTSFRLALGSTYDNLTQREMKAGNKEKAEEYFKQAQKYYEETLEVEPKNNIAVYSIGALYYNRAASMLSELIELENKGDYSKSALAKQTEMRKQILNEFESALPYFQDAEKLDPNDLNTLLALKEIYARKDDFETSGEFKKRVEIVRGGGKVESSYFAGK